jgi:hypothetical protein
MKGPGLLRRYFCEARSLAKPAKQKGLEKSRISTFSKLKFKFKILNPGRSFEIQN